MGKKKETIMFSITVPTDINEKLVAEAAEEGRSKSQQVLFIVKKHFEPKDQPVAAAVAL